MAITLKSSASCGDIIYSMPLARYLHETTKENIIYLIDSNTHHAKNREVNTFDMLETLLLRQDYIYGVYKYKNQKIDYNLDQFRKCKNFRNTPIWINHFQSQNIQPKPEYFRKWIDVGGSIVTHHAVFSETKRYRNYGFDLAGESSISSKFGKTVFCGTDSEYENFKSEIPHAQTYNLLDVANLINQSSNLYCNQSAILTIAQGLAHKSIYLAKDKSFNNTVFGNEKILL
jgi:hypothetical protein